MACEATDLAGQVLRLQEDPTARTEFIHSFARWQGDLAIVAAILDQDQIDPDISSGLCAALGLVTEVTERQKVRGAVTRLCQHALDGGTHGAAAFALRRWKETEPDLVIPELEELPQARIYLGPSVSEAVFPHLQWSPAIIGRLLNSFQIFFTTRPESACLVRKGVRAAGRRSI